MIQEWIKRLRSSSKLYLQVHNFPDHDAVASAFAFQQFLKQFQIESSIVYVGSIQRISLEKMIQSLSIELTESSDAHIGATDEIVVIDACPGHQNVAELGGRVVGVIDHHLTKPPDGLELIDIRSDYGACSSVVFSYYMEMNVRVSPETAAAILMGIYTDTAYLTRGVSPFDIEVFSKNFFVADNRLVRGLIRNYLQLNDLTDFHYMLDHLEIRGDTAKCYFENGCSKNLMGILGDFLLALDEINLVWLIAKTDNGWDLSIRSEKDDRNATEMMMRLVNGWGSGGGHAEMSGGFVSASKADLPQILERIEAILSE